MSDERADRTRIDKAIDFLLGKMCEDTEFPPGELIVVLSATGFRPNLANRQKLLELIEAEMPKEEAKP
jgi:hypothetical protein